MSWRPSVGYYAAFTLLGLGAAALGPTLPGLAERTGSQLSEISLLFTGRSLGFLVGSLLGGRLFDRLPGHPVIVAVLILMAWMRAMVPVMPILWMLVIVFLVLGVAEAVLDVGGNVLLVWVHGDRAAPFLNGLHFFFGAGAFLAPLIVAQAILRSGDILWAYWAFPPLAFPVAIWLMRLPSPTTRTGQASLPAQPVNPWLVVLVASFFMLYVGAEIGYGGWVFTYMVSLGLGDEISAAAITATFWGIFTLGRLLGIPIAVRWRPHQILLIDLLGCLLSLTIILIWPLSPLALWLGTAGFGLSMASIFPTMLSMAGLRIALSGRVTAWFYVGASAGAMSIPWLIGQLLEGVGPHWMMYAILTALILACTVGGFIHFGFPKPGATEVSELRV